MKWWASVSFLSNTCPFPPPPAFSDRTRPLFAQAGRFQIREVRSASLAEGANPLVGHAALSLQEDDEFAIAIVQDGKLVP